jgi:RNA polymerase sigma-70 factor, ECF subfamily
MNIETLYQQYAPELYRFALRKTRNHEDAEDVVSAAFETALRNWERYAEQGKARYWLYSIVNCRIVDHVRRQQRQSRNLARAWYPDDVAPDTEAEHRLTALEMINAAPMPPRQRQALVLRYIEDRSIEDTARIMGTSRLAARQLSCRGRQVLQKALDI